MLQQGTRDRSRLGVSAAFLTHAVIAGTFAARIPAIKHALHISDTQLGLALFGMAIGTLIGGRLGGRIATRLGPRSVVRGGLPLFAAVLFLIALAPDLAVLAVILLAFGILAAVVDVSMNTEAVVVERELARPLMSGFHGMWSVGLLVGALTGAAAAAVGLDPAPEFAMVAVVVTAASAPALARLPLRHVDGSAPKEPGDGWSLAVVLFGFIAFCSFFVEGVAADWSAVFVHDRAGASSAVAATAFAGFSLGMVTCRLTGDRLTSMVGPVRLVATSTAVGATGLALALLYPVPAVGVIGFTMLGLGLGPVVPTVLSAAAGAHVGAVEDIVSRVFTFGYVGGVIGPAVIGFTAGAVGLRAALLIPLCLVLYACASSPRLGTAAA
jgi:fucose permease